MERGRTSYHHTFLTRGRTKNKNTYRIFNSKENKKGERHGLHYAIYFFMEHDMLFRPHKLKLTANCFLNLLVIALLLKNHCLEANYNSY